MRKILFQDGSSLILNFGVHFCFILCCQKVSWLVQYSTFSNFFFHIQRGAAFTGVVKGIDDLDISKVNSKELSGLKEIKGAEDGGVGDAAVGEQVEEQGDGEGRHGEGDADGGGGGGAGEEGAEMRGIESKEEAIGGKVKSLWGDQPDVRLQGGEGVDQGGEAGFVGGIISHFHSLMDWFIPPQVVQSFEKVYFWNIHFKTSQPLRWLIATQWLSEMLGLIYSERTKCQWFPHPKETFLPHKIENYTHTDQIFIENTCIFSTLYIVFLLPL